MSYKINCYQHLKPKSHSGKHRKSVPKALKDRLWDTTYGPEAGQGECYVCGMIINSKRFEAGHIKAVYHGGSTTLDNLKCICSTCNKSMGTQNLEDFRKTYFPAIRKKIKDRKHFKCDCCCHSPKDKESPISFTKEKQTFDEPKLLKSPVTPNNIILESEYNNKYDGYESDETIYDTDEEEQQERQKQLLLMLDKYRFVPKT